MSRTHDTLPHQLPSDSDSYDLQSMSAELVASACLAGVSGAAQGVLFLLVASETLIGRVANANIILDDKALSARHAKLVWDGERHLLTDLGSTNGTFLNGKRLMPNETVPISFGDTIQLANTVLKYTQNPHQDHTQAIEILPQQNNQQPGNSQLINAMPAASGYGPDAQLLMRLLQDANVQEAEPPSPSLDEQIDKFLKYWAVVRRHGVVLLSMIAFCAAIGNVTVFLKPPKSEATFRMRLTPKKSNDPLERNYERNDERTAEFFATATQNFQSASLVEQTLKTLGEKPSKPRVLAVLGSLKLDSIAISLYVGSFTDSDPSFAFKFLQAHVDNYLSGEIQRSLRVVQSEVGFLEERMKETEEGLRKTELELKDFKSKHLDGLPEYAQEHFTSHEALQTRRGELSASLQRTQLELTLARKRLREESPLAIQRAQRATPYEEAMVEVKRKISEARAKGLRDEHPELVALNNQQKELETRARQAIAVEATDLDRTANPGLIELRNKVADLEVAAKGTQAELGQIGASLSRVNNIMGQLPAVEARYAELTRSYTASQELHKRLFERLRSSQLQLELERTSAAARYEIVAPPESSGVPIRRALLLRTGIGAAVGFVIGALIAFIIEFRRYLVGRKARRTAIVPATRGNA